MPTEKSSSLLNQILLALRWFALILLALLAGLFPGETNGANTAAILVLYGLWLLTLHILHIFQKTLPFRKFITVGLDLVFALVVFIASGAFTGALLLAGLLPVITAALEFNLQSSYVLVIIITVVHVVSAVFFQEFKAFWLDLLVDIAGLTIAATLSGFLGKQLSIRLKYLEFFRLSEKQEQERIIRDRVFALDNLTSMIYSSLNFDRLMDLALDMSMKALSDPEEGLSPLISAFLLIENEKFVIGSSRRLTQADTRISLDGKEGVLKEAIASGEIMIIDQATSDPELKKIIALVNSNSICISPLISGFDVFGALLFAHPEKEYFSGFKLTVIEIVTRLVKVAFDNAKLYSDLEEEKQRMIELQDETQKKLARDLHDGPTQTVAAIAMRVNFSRRLIERDMIQEAAEELFKIEDLSRRSTKEIRHMLFTLRPLVLESNGLIAALHSLAEKMGETYDQNVVIDAEEFSIEELEMNKQGILFYIIEEAVNNARKHAQASEIRVIIFPPVNEIIRVEVVDNGVGFNVGAIDQNYENRGSLGMVNLRERSELLNGIFRIESAEGEGTRVKVWIPISETAREKLRQKL